MVAQIQEVIRRIRIKRVETDPTLYHSFVGYTGFGRFNSFFIGETIRDKLKVKPIAALKVTYREVGFQNANEYTTYGFVDFTGIENLESTGLEERTTLLQGEEVSIIISPTETWILSLEERDFNLLLGSQSSETGYYFPRDHILNPRSNMYDRESEFTGFVNPFCGEQEEEGIGYRDAYSTWRFEE